MPITLMLANEQSVCGAECEDTPTPARDFASRLDQAVTNEVDDPPVTRADASIDCGHPPAPSSPAPATQIVAKAQSLRRPHSEDSATSSTYPVLGDEQDDLSKDLEDVGSRPLPISQSSLRGCRSSVNKVGSADSKVSSSGTPLATVGPRFSAPVIAALDLFDVLAQWSLRDYDRGVGDAASANESTLEVASASDAVLIEDSPEESEDHDDMFALAHMHSPHHSLDRLPMEIRALWHTEPFILITFIFCPWSYSAYAGLLCYIFIIYAPYFFTMILTDSDVTITYDMFSSEPNSESLYPSLDFDLSISEFQRALPCI